MPKNTIDDINVDYRRYDYDINEETIYHNTTNEKKNNNDICECIYKYKLNIFGNRENKLYKNQEK